MKKLMASKLWKRNAVVATVLLFVCIGIYLNWAYQRDAQTPELTEVLNEELVMNSQPEAELVIGQDAPEDAMQTAMASLEQQTSSEEYFAQIRLSRQESRDSAVQLLQETIAYETGSDESAASAASDQLSLLVNRALDEAQVESLIIAKGYDDCVCFMNDGSVSVAVSAPEDGLSEAAVATIADVVLSQSDYKLSEIRVVEVH